MPIPYDPNYQWHQAPNTFSNTGVQQYIPGTEAILIANNIGYHFVLISSGHFQMGSPHGEEGREPNINLFSSKFGKEPRHEVVISKHFWLGKMTCNQRFWKAVMGNDNNPSHFKDDNKPVESVSWHDVMLFIERLNAKFHAAKFRLPTEAEWEYACRAETNTPFSLGKDANDQPIPGNTITPHHANYDGTQVYHGGIRGDNRKQTVAVDQFTPNAWGLFQMHGNVWEWCEDAWDESLTSRRVTDPRKTAPPNNDIKRMVRGGSWKDSPNLLRSATRGSSYPERSGSHIGFRLVLEL